MIQREHGVIFLWRGRHGTVLEFVKKKKKEKWR